NSTLVARSNIVHVLTNRQQQKPYSWRELSDSEPGKEMTKRKDMLPPGKIAAFLMDQKSRLREKTINRVFRQREHGQRTPINDNRRIEIHHLEEIYVNNGNV
ncbi:MAG: hypothetical protein EZS28_014284, partial [Streblomastix strix]